jgi:ubiquitin-like-conjugating enzyme ATG3
VKAENKMNTFLRTPHMIRSAMGTLRDRFTDPIEHGDFFATGQIGTKDFEAAGEYLTTKFPSWQWHEVSDLINPVSKLDLTKHVLKFQSGVPCRRRLNDTFAAVSAQQETTVVDGEDFRSDANSGAPGNDEDGWIKTANLTQSQEGRGKDVRTLDESGNIGEIEVDESDNIPDMEDEEDPEALIPDYSQKDR